MNKSGRRGGGVWLESIQDLGEAVVQGQSLNNAANGSRGRRNIKGGDELKSSGCGWEDRLGNCDIEVKGSGGAVTILDAGSNGQ